jgi:hypothetical protein
MGLRQSACVGALCLAAALLSGREPSLAAQLRIDRLTLSDVLDQYDRGHAESVIARLAALQASDLAPLAIDLLQNGESWIAAGGWALNTRRRRIGATVGLELADAALRLDTASPANRWATWIRVRPAIEWGCVRIRRNSAEQPERLWHLASIALASRAMDTALLLGETGRRGPLPESQHVRHAASQFPNEPRFRLAEAIVSEWPLLNEDTPDRSGTTVENLSPKVLSRPRAQTEKERGKVSRQTVRRQFERLLGVDEVSAEAHLHLGYQRFLDHDSAGALHDFQ